MLKWIKSKARYYSMALEPVLNPLASKLSSNPAKLIRSLSPWNMGFT